MTRGLAASPRLGVLSGLVLAVLGGCAKPLPLADTPVRAGSAGELAEFRAGLGRRFPAEELHCFDTAQLELKLDAMARDIKTASAREEQVQAAIHGRTVRQAEILGWQARRTRLLGEITFMSGLLEKDLRARQRTAATGTPQSVTTHIQNEQDILARLRRDLAATEEQLAGWGAAPGGS